MRQFHPELYQSSWIDFFKSPARVFWLTRHREHLLCGDSRAAMVTSIAPLLVAAYTDELDCVAILKFPTNLVLEYGLNIGDRLLTVNLYTSGGIPVADLSDGPLSYHRYSNFFPFIAEFLSEDRIHIEYRKSQIAESEWERTKRLADEYIVRNGITRVRDGRPMHCGKPA